MKCSVSSSDLLKVLQKASGAIGSNPVLPILEDFLFKLDNNKLTISSTDLETSIVTSIDVISDDSGAIAIPGRILTDTLKALPDQPITIDVDEETFGIEITSAYGKYKLAGDNPDDFPKIPEPETNDKIEVSGDLVTKSISKTLFATSNDELRIAMTGVFVQIDFDKITFVATDAHKLVKYSFTQTESNVSSSFILPKKTLNLLKGIIHNEEKITIAFTKSNAFFSLDNTEVVCRLIDSKYPDYNAVIPTDNPYALKISRSDFLNSLKRIAIYANKTTNQVSLSINESTLHISAQDLDFSNEASEKLACSYSGDPIIIGFNAKFLIEMLGVMSSTDVLLNMSTPNRAGILVPSDETAGEEILMLVMPVMLNH